MEALQFVKLERGVLQILSSNKPFTVKATAVSYSTNNVNFQKISLFSKFVIAESKEMSYVNLFVQGELTVFRHITTLYGMEVEENRIVAYGGVTLRRSFRNYNSIVLESDSRVPGQDAFVVLQTASKLTVKQLGGGEVLRVRKGAVVLKNMECREEQPIPGHPTLTFQVFTGPGLIGIDPPSALPITELDVGNGLKFISVVLFLLVSYAANRYFGQI